MPRQRHALERRRRSARSEKQQRRSALVLRVPGLWLLFLAPISIQGCWKVTMRMRQTGTTPMTRMMRMKTTDLVLARLLVQAMAMVPKLAAALLAALAGLPLRRQDDQATHQLLMPPLLLPAELALGLLRQ